MNNNRNSPFTPGNPVPVELFVGRSKQINEILRYIGQILSGKQENVFLVGDRGIGKSSLASFLRYYVNTQTDIFGIHVCLRGVSILEEMVHHIFEQILKETKSQPIFKNISKFFPPEEDLKELVNLKELVRRFPEALHNILEKIKEQKKGLFIILDDINGLVEKSEFANWYKSFVDEIATHYENFPVFMMLIGLPEKRNKLFNLQPSLVRIFRRVIEIKKLTDKEVEDFLSKAFGKVNIKIEPDAMKLMVVYSSGLPILMHKIGDATFWIDTDGIIDKKDATNGILVAVPKKFIGQYCIS